MPQLRNKNRNALISSYFLFPFSSGFFSPSSTIFSLSIDPFPSFCSSPSSRMVFGVSCSVTWILLFVCNRSSQPAKEAKAQKGTFFPQCQIRRRSFTRTKEGKKGHRKKPLLFSPICLSLSLFLFYLSLSSKSKKLVQPKDGRRRKENPDPTKVSWDMNMSVWLDLFDRVKEIS